MKKVLFVLALASCAALLGCDRGGLTCDAPKLACGEACVNAQTDPANCGGCGLACASGQSCSAGVCTCASGATRCGEACVDTGSDTENCGTCEERCEANELCEEGACVEDCAAGRTLCGTGCVDVDSDRANCGACGTSCAQGQSCAGGACTATVFAACFNTGELVALDDDLQPAAASTLVGSGPQALARGANRVLVADAVDNALYGFDPASSPLAKSAGADRLGKAASQLLVKNGRAFVVNTGDNTVQVVDLTKATPAEIDTSRTIDEIATKVGSPASEANTAPAFAAFAGEKLYVSLTGTCYPDPEAGHQAGNRLLEVDVSTTPGALGRELVFAATDYERDEGVTESSPRPAGVAARGTTLYVAIGNLAPGCMGSAGPGYLAVVDTAAATLSARNLKLPDACRNPAYVLASETRLYVSCLGSYGAGAQPEEALVVLDAATEQVVATTVFPRCEGFEDGPNACRTAVPGRLALHGNRLLVADNNAGRILVTDLDGAIPAGFEQGVQICGPKCYGENTDCYQFTSDVLSIR